MTFNFNKKPDKLLETITKHTVVYNNKGKTLFIKSVTFGKNP